MTFGEVCSFKNRSHESTSNTDGRRWHQGVFVGIDRRTGQYMLHCGNEVKLARTVIRLPESNKWDKEAPRDPEIVFKEKADIEQNDFENQVSLARQRYINSSDLEEHGMTRGCP